MTQDDEDLKKDSKIRKGKSTIRLRKRKKVHAKRTEGLADEKNFKLPLIKQQQIKKRVITPEVQDNDYPIIIIPTTIPALSCAAVSM